jgi:hypothetical protein
LKVECSLIAKYINTPEGITQPDWSRFDR